MILKNLQVLKRNRDWKSKKPCKQVNNQKTIEKDGTQLVVIEQKLIVKHLLSLFWLHLPLG